MQARSQDAGAPVSTGRVVAVWLVAAAGLLLFALPRFGALDQPPSRYLHDFVTAEGRHLQGQSVDMVEYLTAVEHYQGVGEAPSVAPFTERLAAPFLAGQLPWEAPISLNVVVVAVLLLGSACLLLAQRRLGFSTAQLLLSAVLYSCSFPVYYWGSFNYVDGAVVGLLAVLLLAVVLERPAAALVVLAVAMLFKESAIVGVPVLLVNFWLGADTARARATRIAGVLLAAAAGLVSARILAPDADTFYNPWLPSPAEIIHYMGANLSRPGPLAQVVLTGVVPVVLTYVGCRRWFRRTMETPLSPRVFWTLVAGVAAGVAVNVQSLLVAQWDGRTLWTVYPFALTLGAAAISPAKVLAERTSLRRSVEAR